VYIQPYMSGTSFLCGLRASVRSFPMPTSKRTKTCGWLSQPLSTMPDKTPRWHIAAFRQPTWFSTRSTTGLPEFYSASLPACHGLMTPADLHILARTDASVLPSAHVTPPASATVMSKLYQHFRDHDLPYGLQDSLPTLITNLVRCSIF